MLGYRTPSGPQGGPEPESPASGAPGEDRPSRVGTGVLRTRIAAHVAGAWADLTLAAVRRVGAVALAMAPELDAGSGRRTDVPASDLGDGG